MVVKFSELLSSYDEQAAESGCLEDWLDYFHSTVCTYFSRCERDNKRASIKGLKQEIIEMATSDLFKFK